MSNEQPGQSADLTLNGLGETPESIPDVYAPLTDKRVLSPQEAADQQVAIDGYNACKARGSVWVRLAQRFGWRD